MLILYIWTNLCSFTGIQVFSLQSTPHEWRYHELLRGLLLVHHERGTSLRREVFWSVVDISWTTVQRTCRHCQAQSKTRWVLDVICEDYGVMTWSMVWWTDGLVNSACVYIYVWITDGYGKCYCAYLYMDDWSWVLPMFCWRQISYDSLAGNIYMAPNLAFLKTFNSGGCFICTASKNMIPEACN